MRKLCVLLAGFILAIASLQANARIVSPDAANFSFTISGSDVTFTNTSSLGSEPGIRKALWTFGDGTSQWTGGLDGTQHHYQSAGSYTVCLKIYRYPSNTSDSVVSADICKTVAIESTCQAGFESTASTSTAFGRYFVAQPWHSQNKKPVQVCWTFGDNHDTCIQYSTTYTGAYSVYHLYSQAGSYNVCVNILYDGGCEAHSCHTVQAGVEDSCRASFEAVASDASALREYFIAQPWHNQNKKPLRICWTFGDNHDTCIQYSTTYTGAYATYHQYAQPGSYNVCVNILYDGGCEAHSCHPIQTSTPDSCRADFERIPVTSSNVLSASFRALPWHNHNKKPVQICWTFGDGTDSCISYGQDYNGPYTINHTYQHAGQYEVCVTIHYYGGCAASKCRLVTVPAENTCSVNIFEVTPSITSLLRAFYASIVSAHPIDHICWYFGDGNDTCIWATSSTPPELFIHHAYAVAGVYHVCVKVFFQGGCLAENCIETVIRTPNDLCGGYITDSLTGPRTFKFRGFSIHNPNDAVLSYHWTFGDGTSATGQEVAHTYTSEGEFRVCLTILTQSGCETRVCNTVRAAGNNQTGLVLSPNPVLTTLHALFYSTHNETVTIRIINSNGVAVRTYTRGATVGANNWDFDLSSLQPGVYLFAVQSPNQQASAMFLKQ